MNAFRLKPQVSRALLCFHFIGLAASLGGRFAAGVIDGRTQNASLMAVLLGRDLIDVSQRQVILPGFLTVLVTGVALTLIRYGLRPPIWVWIKIGLAVSITAIALFAVGPASAAAQHWAHWSSQHGQLAPQFGDSVRRSNFYGRIVRALFLITIAVAVWKPFSSFAHRKTKPTTRRQSLKRQESQQ